MQLKKPTPTIFYYNIKITQTVIKHNSCLNFNRLIIMQISCYTKSKSEKKNCQISSTHDH